MPHGLAQPYGLRGGCVGLWVKVLVAGRESNIGFDSRKMSHGFEKSNDFSGGVCFGWEEVWVAEREGDIQFEINKVKI